MPEDDVPDGEASAPILHVESPQHPLTVRQHPRQVDSYTVFGHELDTLAAGNASTNLGLACTGAGIAVTLLVALVTVPFDLKALAIAVGAFIGSVGVTVGFGAAARREHRRAQDVVERIKSEQRQL